MSEKYIKWTEENEVYLLKLLSDNTNLEKLAKKMRKSERDIIHKLKKITVNMLSENKSKEEIKNKLKILTDEQINKISEKYKKKKSKKQNNNYNESADLSDIGLYKTKSKTATLSNNIELKQIYTLLNEINQKINILINQNNEIKNHSENESEDIKNEVSKTQQNNDESSSFISSGSDTDDVKNLIKNKTDELNMRKTKYLTSLKK